MSPAPGRLLGRRPGRLLGRRTPVRVPATRPAGTALIEIDRLRVELGGRAVLDQVDLVVHTGEVVALVGPNGAGKSTLLAAIGGDVAAAAGVIRIDGAPQSDWTSTELALRRAVLTQRSVLSFPFTVAEVVRMGRAPWAGLPAEESDDPIVEECLAATDVAQFADRTFTALSGGEQARAALARVLAQRAAALLLDEPTAALDLHHQELVLRLARQRAAAGDAVVVVLHDLGLAGAYADRIALLSAGRLRAVGPPDQVLTGALLSEVYRHDIEVLPHPETGLPLVVPRRQHPTPAGARHGKERNPPDE
ncbi:iron complex transport system ATP-binding protein [Micromonospora sp. Llam0]|uniref:heme ABC transporter ATP-binding protein n=1 Tax=Micromonospora sp. Llam0 TaxID=2485143 RepID=UPI000F47884D|nr:heme ABC transporter ATP-binding protein [Micromonospora sp. Llam0]ROO62485.1 iron complex transport system ATP-binding protein [Micromonospora sp. Llam0]